MVCDRAIWLRQGRIAEAGDVPRVVAAYETYLRERESRKAPAVATDVGPRAFPWIAETRLSRGEEDAPSDTFITGEELTVTVRYEVPQSPTVVHVGVSIERNDAVEVFATATNLADVRPASASGSVRLRFPRLALMSGAYALSVFLLDEHGLHVYDRRVRTCTFFVEQLVQQLGLCYLEHQWEAGVAATDVPQPFLQREPARL
jgi:lipopolysaccharide transport system ATP-binding protein